MRSARTMICGLLILPLAGAPTRAQRRRAEPPKVTQTKRAFNMQGVLTVYLLQPPPRYTKLDYKWEWWQNPTPTAPIGMKGPFKSKVIVDAINASQYRANPRTILERNIPRFLAGLKRSFHDSRFVAENRPVGFGGASGKLWILTGVPLVRMVSRGGDPKGVIKPHPAGQKLRVYAAFVSRGRHAYIVRIYMNDIAFDRKSPGYSSKPNQYMRQCLSRLFGGHIQFA